MEAISLEQASVQVRPQLADALRPSSVISSLSTISLLNLAGGMTARVTQGPPRLELISGGGRCRLN